MIPFRLCCMQQHYGLICLDDKVQCCYCFDRFTIEELATDEEGSKTDVCQPCWDWEQERLNNVLEQ